MPEPSNTVPRRAVTKAAAWSVPAVGVITAAPAFAASPSLPPFVGSRLLTYRVWAKPNGVVPLPSQPVPPYTTPPGTVDLGIWTVHTYPGTFRTFPPDDLRLHQWVVEMTMSPEGIDLLRAFEVAEVRGSMVHNFTVAGDVVAPGSRTAELTIWQPVPAEGDILLTARGETAWETPTADYGSFLTFPGSWTATLTTEGSIFIDSIGLAAALDPAGQEVYCGPTLIYPYIVD